MFSFCCGCHLVFSIARRNRLVPGGVRISFRNLLWIFRRRFIRIEHRFFDGIRLCFRWISFRLQHKQKILVILPTLLERAKRSPLAVLLVPQPNLLHHLFRHARCKPKHCMWMKHFVIALQIDHRSSNLRSAKYFVEYRPPAQFS